MQLHAISAGEWAQTRRFTGTVHSVFAHACNVELEEGRLVALLAAKHGNTPNGIRFDLPPGFAFHRACRVGERVGCRAGVARFAGSELTLRLDTAPIWRLGLDPLSADLGRTRVLAAWRHACRCLRWHAQRTGRAGSSIPAGRLSALARATRVLDADGAERAAVGLIGRGVGLTPAGYDVVVGFLAGLRASARGRRAHTHFRDALGARVRSMAVRTNPISRIQIEHAAAGAFAEPIARLALAIARGVEGTDVEDAAQAALAVGATSGSDAVRGLLLGLAAWGRALPRREGSA
jgi:hypothetical protein